MPVLYIYKKQSDKTPIAVFSGCPWKYDPERGLLFVRDFCFTSYERYYCVKLDNTCNDMIFFAYGEV